ncbi:MAG TPA: sn-glycerol-3-phosphate ABC transporter ATP-binding protein UgpC [Candidatus Binatia bacterium]|nr:sn-glycerol-3-phosphate ABC transporter ATP-binding protein UgpC [Candidatus Binatia bacterium]
MASVAFEHVDKTFPDGTRAVVDCNLTVADGELVVLVGPSGCGKSTLLRLVAGLEEATAGTIRIGDRVANALTPRERNVAMVFQDYALYPHMSVRENLEFPLRMRGLDRAERARRVAWAADVLGLAAVLDRRPRQLSGGQQQRVAMGRALVREPSVFLLDEPLSNLDAKLRVEVRAEIADLQRRMRTTMLYVTHDQTEAMTLGDRVAVLRAGRVLQIAPPRELYEHPADAYVAGFIGSPPMNLLPARVVGAAEGRPAVAIAGQTISLDGKLADGTRPRADGDVIAGVRPEGLALADDTQADAAGVLCGVVEHVEWLGHETLAHVVLGPVGRVTGDARLTARLAGMQPLARDQEVRLVVRPRSLHLFPRDEGTPPSPTPRP